MTGNATVDGTADVALTWLENANPVPLFATGGVGIDNGLEVPDTIALDYKIVSGDGASCSRSTATSARISSMPTSRRSAGTWTPHCRSAARPASAA